MQDFLLWLPLAVWLVWSIIAPTKFGTRARHSLWCIWRPMGPVNSDGSATQFVHVQERGEFRLHKLLAIFAGLPFALLLPFMTFVTAEPQLILLVLGAQLVVMILVDGLTRKINAIDYAGHGAEIMAAEAAGRMEYRFAEVARLRRNRDKQGQDVPAMLQKTRWLARIVYLLGRW